MEIVHAVAASSLTLRRSICGTKIVKRTPALGVIPKIEQNQTVRVNALEISLKALFMQPSSQVQNAAHWVKDPVVAEVEVGRQVNPLVCLTKGPHGAETARNKKKSSDQRW